MDALHMMRRMAHNEAWANHRLHNTVAGLDANAYRLATRTSFFPSIHLTLSHILHVDLYYVDALLNGGRGRQVWVELERCDREGSFEQVRTAQAEVDRQLIDWLGGLTDPAALDAPIHMERRTHIQTDLAGNVLLHLFEHQIHHRGQVHAMLSGTSLHPPQLDEFHLMDDLPLRINELKRLNLPLV